MTKKRRFSNLNRRPRDGEYTTYDQRTGIRIWSTDVATDFWGKQVHKNNVATPEATLYMDYNLPIEPPITTHGSGTIRYQTGTWFIQTDSAGNLTSIFYSDDYVNGLYTEATQAQIDAYVPVFNDQTYSVGYNGMSQYVPTLVATLLATDPAGEGILWSIEDGNDDGIFSLDPADGKLYISSPTAISNNSSYELEIKVTSYFPGYPYDTANITVNTQSSVNAPVITSGTTFNVAENTTSVTTMTATDADGDTTQWSITGGADAALFSINATTGALVFSSAPNYESPADADTNNIYVVEITASDGVLSSSSTLSITVTNVNEAPVITSASTVNAAENQTTVMTCTATDQDAGATITWSIVGGADQALFDIDSSTGALTFTDAPDYENPTDADTDNVYVVTVRASDGTNNTDQTISVTVTNVNEEASFGTLDLWLDATATSSLTLSGTDVISWSDRSGNGRSFVTTVGKRPVYDATGLGSVAGVKFNVASNTGQHMYYTDAGSSWQDFLINATSTKAAVFIVFKQTTRDSGTPNCILASGSSNTRFFMGIESNTSGSTYKGYVEHYRVASNSADVTNTDISGFNTASILSSTYEPSSSPIATLYLNGASVATSTDAGTMSGSTHLGQSMYLGTNEANAGVANDIAFRGVIAAVLVYSELTETVSNVCSYLTTKYGI